MRQCIKQIINYEMPEWKFMELFEELRKSLIVPFVIGTDREYYTALGDKLKQFVDLLKESGINGDIVSKAENFKNELIILMEEYYLGNITDAQIYMTDIIDEICDKDSDASGSIYKCAIFRDDEFKGDIPFYRARLDSDEDGFKAAEMMSIPFSMRTRTSTERFSMPGFPCLYLGNTTYVCWLEMGKPADHRFNVSPVYIDRGLKLFDLTATLGDLYEHGENGEICVISDVSEGLIKRLMLMMCSSFRIKETGRNFKSEYIIPQLIMMACKKRGLDGVVYISTKISDANMYKVCAIDVALYAGYPGKEFNNDSDKTELEKYISIDDSFNFAMFKHIFEIEPVDESLWIEKCKWVKNIEANGRRFPYKDTEFFDFDKFLIRKWKEKKVIE